MGGSAGAAGAGTGVELVTGLIVSVVLGGAGVLAGCNVCLTTGCSFCLRVWRIFTNSLNLSVTSK